MTRFLLVFAAVLSVAQIPVAGAELLAGTLPRLLSPDEFQRREVEAYTEAVMGKITDGQSYPPEALDQAIEGTAAVRMTIGTDGRVKAVSLLRSSGHAVLDDAAVTAVRGLDGLPTPPALLRGREFHLAVPVTFRLE
ncbi:MAG: energy transducer TonB [Betaproteobacteria bacterium]|jgi:TonB family protein